MRKYQYVVLVFIGLAIIPPPAFSTKKTTAGLSNKIKSIINKRYPKNVAKKNALLNYAKALYRQIAVVNTRKIDIKKLKAVARSADKAFMCLHKNKIGDDINFIPPYIFNTKKTVSAFVKYERAIGKVEGTIYPDGDMFGAHPKPCAK